MDYMNIKIQWYNNGIYNNVPNGAMTFKQFATNIKEPSERLKDVFDRLHKATLSGDLKTKDKIKQEELFFTTPTINVSGTRCYKDINVFNPFLVAEYDKIKYPELLRDYIFESFKSCIFAFCSPSGSGVKFIFKIPQVETVEEYKQYYWGLAYFLDKFKGLDTANQNCVLPLFTSYDPQARLREDAEDFTRRGYKENAFDFNAPTLENQGQYNKEYLKYCANLMKYMFRDITDNGHPQVRSNSLKFGGWIAMYGGNPDKAWNYLKGLIEANEYLSKGTSGYLKTAKEMFYTGLQHPIIIYKNENKKEQKTVEGIAPTKKS